MDDVLEDVERRTRELRGWVQRGTNPRRSIYLGTALYDELQRSGLLASDAPITAEAKAALDELLNGLDSVSIAAAIFSAEEITSERNKRIDSALSRVRPSGRYSQPSFAGFKPAEEGPAGPRVRGRKVREGASEYKRERRPDPAGVRGPVRRPLYDYREDRDG